MLGQYNKDIADEELASIAKAYATMSANASQYDEAHKFAELSMAYSLASIATSLQAIASEHK